MISSVLLIATDDKDVFKITSVINKVINELIIGDKSKYWFNPPTFNLML